MKNRSIRLNALVCALLAAIVFTGAAGCKEKDKPFVPTGDINLSAAQDSGIVYNAYYNTVFTVPPSDAKWFLVLDDDAEKVELHNMGFAVAKREPYTLYTMNAAGKLSKAGINVIDNSPVKLNAPYPLKYIKTGVPFTLPQITAEPASPVTLKLFQGATDITGSVSGGVFTPAAAGEYTLRATAEYAGYTAELKIPIIATANADDFNKIYALDTARGLEAQTVRRLGVRLNTSAMTTPDGGGAARIDITGKHSFIGLPEDGQVFYLRNPLFTNWDDVFSSVYFWLYIERNVSCTSAGGCNGNHTYNVVFNGHQQTVTAGSWTKIEVADFTAFAGNGGVPSAYGIIDMDDLVGSFVAFDNRTHRLEFRFDTMYMSAVYGVPKA